MKTIQTESSYSKGFSELRHEAIKAALADAFSLLLMDGFFIITDEESDFDGVGIVKVTIKVEEP
jgi:hypothetical protein